MLSLSPIVVICALLTPVICFLLGSIPWGVIISRLFYHTDIREHGSGNIGTTNALRTLGKGGGAAVFILDFLKGLLAGFLGVFLGRLAALEGTPEVYLSSDSTAAAAAAAQSLQVYGLILGLAMLTCVLGHVFSPWLRFKGGKGIACAVGCVFFAFGWQGALIELGVFIVLLLLTRYVSVGSIAVALVCPFIAFWSSHGEWTFVILSTLTGLLVVWAHRANIARLRAGTEPRIFSKDKG